VLIAKRRKGTGNEGEGREGGKKKDLMGFARRVCVQDFLTEKKGKKEGGVLFGVATLLCWPSSPVMWDREKTVGAGKRKRGKEGGGSFINH